MNNKKLSSLNNYGKLCIMIGVILLMPIIVIPFYPTESQYFWSFFIPGMSSIVLGALWCIFGKRFEPSSFYTVTQRNSTFIILFAWIYAFLIGTVPFLIGKQLPFVRALFEIVSGFTSTGLSTMDVSITPKCFLLYRSISQFIGGIGFVILFLVIVRDKQSMDLFSAEGHPDRLKPNLQITGRTIMAVYLLLTLIGAIGYVIMGMPIFDAINHALCGISTGGFSTMTDNFDSYSKAIQIWTILIMLAGSINMAVLLVLPTKKFRQGLKNTELKMMFVILVVTTPVVMSIIAKVSSIGLFDNFVYSLFNIVAAMSTAGFGLGNCATMPQVVVLILSILMIFGGCLGSTSGAIKLNRMYIFFRRMVRSVSEKLFPSRRIKTMKMYRPQGLTIIDESEEKEAVNYIGIYFIMYFLGVIALMLASNCQLHEAMFEFASSLGTVGLTIGVTSPSATTATLIVEMIGMLLGRLEIYPVLLGFKYTFDSIRNLFKK